MNDPTRSERAGAIFLNGQINYEIYKRMCFYQLCNKCFDSDSRTQNVFKQSKWQRGKYAKITSTIGKSPSNTYNNDN